MKNVLVFVLFMFTVVLTGQRYDFNYLSKYNTKIENYERGSVVYCNSKDSTYFLYLTNENNKITASLYDITNNMMYQFDVLETIHDNEVLFDFKYSSSRKLDMNNSRYKKYEFEFNTTQEDSLKQEIDLSIYYNSKRKKSISKVNLKTTKHKDNLFHLFKFSCLHPYEYVTVLPNGNYLVDYATGLTIHNTIFEHTLLLIKEVKFTLEVPVNEAEKKDTK